MDVEALTILRARSRRLAKLVHPDGTMDGYDLARTVDLIPHPVADLPALHRLLIRLGDRRDCAIVRGEPFEAGGATRVRRLLYTDRKTGDAPTLRDVPRRWLALDVDSLPAPEALDLRDLAACGREALAALPAAFLGAGCIVQATASHTIKPGLRLRLWCWLTRPVMGAELKRWLHDLPVDRSVFGAVQPIYTAAPVFMGRPDPLPARLVLLPGGEVVPPAAEALAPPARRAAAPLDVRTDTKGKYVRRAMESAVARILGASARHPAILAETRGLARLVAAGLLSQGDMQRAIHAAARAVGKDDPDEIDAIIAWAGDHPSGAAPEVRHAR